MHQQALCHLWSPDLQEVDEGSERHVGFLCQPGDLETGEPKAESKAWNACSVRRPMMQAGPGMSVASVWGGGGESPLGAGRTSKHPG